MPCGYFNQGNASELEILYRVGDHKGLVVLAHRDILESQLNQRICSEKGVPYHFDNCQGLIVLVSLCIPEGYVL